MPIIFDSKKLIPAPRVNFGRTYITTQDGKKIGKNYTITVNGELVSFKGSPNSSKVFWTSSGYPSDEVLTDSQKLSSILRKQEALRELFSNEGKLFEVQGYDGATPISFNAKNIRINIPEGQWYDRCPYTIEMEADVLYGLNLNEDNDITYYINSFDEEWSLEPADDNGISFRLNHRLNAVGKRHYDVTGTLTAQAWENARDYIINNIGLGLDQSKLIATGVYNNDNLQAFNYTRTQSINEAGGSFSVNESWLAIVPESNYPAIEEYTVTSRTNNQDGLVTASVEGTIRGLEKRNNTTYGLISTKYANASGRFNEIEPNLFSRVDSFISGVTLSSRIMSSTTSINDKAGVITYLREYSNRPDMRLSGANSEVFTVSFDNPGSIIPEIFVIGRTSGPVLQDLQTYTARKKTLNIEAVFPPSNRDYTASWPDTNSAVDVYIPAATIVKKIRDQENFSQDTGRYSRQVTWVFEV